MEVKKPRVLLINDGEFGGASLLFREIAADESLEFKVEVLDAFYPPRSLAEEEIASHLRRNEYDLVLTPDISRFLLPIKAQHLGKVVAYGVAYVDFENYDGYLDLLSFPPGRSGPYSYIAEQIGTSLGLSKVVNL